MDSENKVFLTQGYVEVFSEHSSQQTLTFGFPSRWMNNKIVSIKVVDFLSGLESTDSSKIIYASVGYQDSYGTYPYTPHYSADTSRHPNAAVIVFDPTIGRHELRKTLGLCYPAKRQYVKGNDQVYVSFFYEDGTAVDFNGVEYVTRIEIHFGPKINQI